MIFIPYGAALSLARTPYMTYAVALLCAIVFTLQLGSSITGSLMYYPQSWNPIKMVTSAFAHADFGHLFGNLIFFMAFAPALEILIGSWLRYLGFILFVAVFTGISYSVSTLLGSQNPLPSLGLSGVVMGMIGLSAYLMPHARIRVFAWFVFFWKTLYVPAWILALLYIGLDLWAMISRDHFGGINLVAHVFGGVGGYLFGVLWLGERREETREELADEIEANEVAWKHGKTRAEAHRYRKATAGAVEAKEKTREMDRFMGLVYQMVKTDRESNAIMDLLERYDLQTPSHELEDIFGRICEWGPSRTALCFGRLLISVLDLEPRHGRVLVVVEQCQAMSRKFVLPDVSRTLFFAQMAIDCRKPDIARHLTADAAARYGQLLNVEQANYLCQQASRMGS